jgi:hypothetical protein
VDEWRRNPTWLAVVDYYAARWPTPPERPDEERDYVYWMLFGVAFTLMDRGTDWVFPPDTDRLDPLVRADVAAARERFRTDPRARRAVLDRFREGPVSSALRERYADDLRPAPDPTPVIDLRGLPARD